MLTVINDLLQLRTIVGFLGERDQFQWWNTAFLSPTGQRFLAINFPQSFFAGALTSVSHAARRLHDDRIGRGRVFHLYHLDDEIERAMYSVLREGDRESYLALIHNRETALTMLKQLAGATVDAPVGPVQVGRSESIRKKDGVREMAMHYLDGFTNDKQVFPYFSIV